MTLTENQDSDIKEHILSVLREKKPETVAELAKIVGQKYPRALSESELEKLLMELKHEGRMNLSSTDRSAPSTVSEFLLSSKIAWFWMTVGLAAATAAIVFIVPASAYPFVYIRYVLGGVFILWLPGYTFMKVVFPTNVPSETARQDLDRVERITLSIGISLALIPMLGLGLNYTPLGIRLETLVPSLLILTIALASAAVAREYSATVTKDAEH